MDFKSFARQVGAVSTDPLVGSDPIPSGEASTASSCSFSLRIEGKSGVTSLQRLGVSFVGPSATLPVTVFVFDEKSQSWVLTGSGDITTTALTKYDLIVPVEGTDASLTIDVYVRVGDPGGLPAGVYTFLVSPDSSSAPIVGGGTAPPANVFVTNFPGTQPVTVTNPLGVLDAANVRINPATEDTLSTLSTSLTTIANNQTNGGQVTQVSISALPAGASTAAKQDTGNASLASIDTKTPALVGGKVPVDASGSSVSVISSTLPTGAATSALQTTGNASLASIDTKTPALIGGNQPVDVQSSVLPTGAATETTLSSIDTKTPALVGGSVPVTVTSSALPTGAATSAKQDTGNTSLSNIDGKLPAQVGGRVPVDASGVTVTVAGAVTVTTGSVSVTSSALPTGASTSALQTTGNTSLSNIDNKTPVLGQALAAASTPAVLPLAQETSLRDMSDRAARLLGHATIQVGGTDVSNSVPVPVVTPTTTISSLADVAVAAAAALASLAAGPSGILVTAHPNNTAVIRVSGADVSTTQGQPLQPGASFIFSVTNANALHAAAESGTQTLCVSAV